jgi:tRNA threonylcarbamoyladenosine modification (KEOPS) complex  Pcc1 subunit
VSVKYLDLVEVDLGKLATAVSDWKSAVDKLKTAAQNARRGMKAKSEKARWAGANATVTRGFVTKTTKEIADLHTEANSIYQVLNDAHTELASLQSQIKTAVQADAPTLGVRVEDIGDGKVRCYFQHIRGDTDERTQDQLDAKQELESRINRLIAHATDRCVGGPRAPQESRQRSAQRRAQLVQIPRRRSV